MELLIVGLLIELIMKRWWKIGLSLILLFVFWTKKAEATEYAITNFGSSIKLEKDSSLTVREKIEVNFLTEKHGIYRDIPYVYKNKGKTVNANVDVISVTDDNGQPVSYTVDDYGLGKKIKIGDPNLMVIGIKNYLISYNMEGVVLDYGKGPEIYWNVTGDKWEVPISKASALVSSPFGKITKTECFGCKSGFGENEANFEGRQNLTIVVQIDKNNALTMSSIKVEDNSWLYILAYVLAGVPTMAMLVIWFIKGRDKRFLEGNIYYEPEDKSEGNVPLINRPHLPLVYSPIDGLSPAEAGTIVDEKVDTKDVVAEIVELARLGYLTIEKMTDKGFLGIENVDYEFKKMEKPIENLNKFQKKLLSDLFEKSQQVRISELKNNFYTKLKLLKSDLYDQLEEKGITDGSIETVAFRWRLWVILGHFGLILILSLVMRKVDDYWPLFWIILGLIPTMILASKMPRKTAKGYNLHRQVDGLKYYLKLGKWREEVMEKNLFLEEMLPLAIALGVVGKLAADMKELELEPPKYLIGMPINSFDSDFRHFSSAAANGLTMSPKGSTGSWSGGSGFGGGVGGGFGGGGGGSW